MKRTADELEIARIVVVIDASRRSRAALEAAASLAARFQAELGGLFVEDADLLRVAELPFARETGYSSPPRRILVSEIERSLRARAEELRRVVEARAKQADLRWSFRVKRGGLTPSTIGASEEADLLIVGHERTPPGPAGVEGEAVLVVCDETPRGRRALEIGLRIAEELGKPVDVMVAGARKDGGTDPEGKPPAWFDARGLRIAAYRGRVETGEDLLRVLRDRKPSILILPRGSSLIDETVADVLFNRVDFPVALAG